MEVSMYPNVNKLTKAMEKLLRQHQQQNGLFDGCNCQNKQWSVV